MLIRSELRADPAGVFVHDLVLEACQRFSDRTLLVDTSYAVAQRITYGEYGSLVESVRGDSSRPVFAWASVSESTCRIRGNTASPITPRRLRAAYRRRSIPAIASAKYATSSKIPEQCC